MASFVYNSFWDDLAKGSIDLDTDTFWVMLIDAAGVAAANKGAHTKRSDVTGEITATGYSAGGKVITCVVSLVVASNRSLFTFQSVNWTGFTGTAAGMVGYKRRGGAASADNLLFLNDFGGNVTLTATTLQVADSVITLQN